MRVAVVPHAPLLVDIPGRPHPLPELVHALAGLGVGDRVVVVTPHGASPGIYRSARGDLRGFGLEVAVEVEGDEGLAQELADRSRIDALDAPLDHGAVVPLALLRPEVAVVCALPGWTGQQDGDVSGAVAAADSLASALTELEGWTIVISAHTSAAVTARAPLTELADGARLHDEIVTALKTDPSVLADLDPQTAHTVGACGLGPLRLLGRLAPDPLKVHHVSAPFGVGYVVAST